jgi:hypothetical protein
MKNKLHKLLFPKQHKALQLAIRLSERYWSRNPIKEKQEVGEDIFNRIYDILEPKKCGKKVGGDGKTSICYEHGKVMLHNGSCSECRDRVKYIIDHHF